MVILGLNTRLHDTSACLVVDGRPVVALEEERFSRDRHTRAFPGTAVRRGLEHANLAAADVEAAAMAARRSGRDRSGHAPASRTPPSPTCKDEINAEVELREAYRPVAPSATVEATREFFGP